LTNAVRDEGAGGDERKRTFAAGLSELRKSLLVALVTVIVVFLGLELWLRLAPPRDWTAERLLAGGPPEARLVGPHPYLTYALTPSFRKDGVSHNSLGYRGPEITAAKPPGTLRILCLGGSSTYGVGASSDLFTWPAQLQLALADAHPATRIEVVNAGVPGYTSYESLIDLELKGVDLAPDIVIVYQGFNDLRAATRAADRVARDNTHYRQRWTAPGSDANGVLAYSRVALLSRWLFTKFQSRVSDLSEYVVVEAHAPQFVRPVGPVALASYRRNLTQIVAVARAAGARVLLVTEAYGEATIHPDEADVVDGGMSAFAQIARDLVQRLADPGTALLDGRRLLPRFEGVFAEIDHLSDHGAQVLGALVAEKVSALGWVLGRSGPAAGSPVPPALDRSPGAVMESEQARRLASLGYAAGSRRPDKGDTAVIVRTGKAQPGLNFYVSGHGPEAVLMDMDGRPVHRWRFAYERAFPDAHLPTTPVGRGFWRRALLLPDGDVIAIFEGQGLIRIDYRSRLRWAAPIGAHHDLFLAPDGQLWVLTRKVQLIPQINAGQPVLEDFVSVLNDEGKVVREISILEAFWRSEHKALLDTVPPSGDLLHTNTIVRLTGARSDEIPAFREGNLLLSIPRLNALAVLDPAREEIVWTLAGLFRFQHTPALVGSRGLLLLDNQWRPDASRALEIDPVTQKVLWQHRGTSRLPFHTEYNGAAYRLDNGDTLLIESDAGRAIEVDRKGQIVWEFRSPHRTPDGLVAALFDLKRIDPADLHFPLQATSR
jgi:lysophospholipase L1-like esterase